MKFDKIAGFYPDLKGLVPADAGFERKALGTVSADAGGYLAVLTTNEVDRDGDIVLPQGLDIDYFTGTLLWNHQLTDLPVGKVVDVQINAAGASGRLVFAEGYGFAQDIKTLVEQGMLKGVSIGFIPKLELKRGTQAFNDCVKAYGLNAEGCNRIVAKAEIVEISVCPVGANKSALIQAMAAKSLVLDSKTEHCLGLDDEASQMLVKVLGRVIALETKSEAPAAAPEAQAPEAVPAAVAVTPAPEASAEPVAPAEAAAAPAAAVPETVAPVPEPAAKPVPAFTVIRLGPRVQDTKSLALALNRGVLV